jgi:SecD/SecF fusion protein
MLQLLNESTSSTLTRTVFTSVTLLALLPMGIAGGSAVASFALPMLFGIVVSTSSSIFIVAPLLYWLGQRRQQKGLPQLRPSREERDAERALIP